MIMIGQATARSEPVPRRWVRRMWGMSDINARQKWMAVWPQLAHLPAEGVRVVDAGCGPGTWALELAMLRPDWSVTGIDRSEECITRAEQAQQRLALDNVRFVRSDVLSFTPSEPADVVLSICSAHYFSDVGEATRHFRALSTWLTPDGMLVLFGPRLRHEVPAVSFLPPPFELRDMFSYEMLQRLCRDVGLECRALMPRVGTLGTIAKQLRAGTRRSRLLTAMTYPLQISLTLLDRSGTALSGSRLPSSAWLLVAGRS